MSIAEARGHFRSYFWARGQLIRRAVFPKLSSIKSRSAEKRVGRISQKRYNVSGETLKPLEWIASTRIDLKGFPEEVRREVGHALHMAQAGEKSVRAKPLSGFGGAGVLEVVANHDGNAYRAVYTVRFAEVIYVLHAFQKKSTRGIATPKAEIDLVRKRLAIAMRHYQETYGREES